MNTSLLFENIEQYGSCFNARKQKYYLDFNDSTISGTTIKKLIQNVKFVSSMPVRDTFISFQAKSINDDAIIQQLEIVFAYLFEKGFNKLTVIFCNLLSSSPYIDVLAKSTFARHGFKDKTATLDKETYLKDFYQKSYAEPNYFRYYIKKDDLDSENENVLADAISFIKFRSSNIEYAESISGAFTEMIDNVWHSESDCIATIKFTGHLIRKDTGEKVSGWFISVVDISNFCIYTKLKTNIEKDALIGLTEKIISKSLPFHKQYFGKNDYSFERFCLISVFQKRITTNSDSGYTGGSGLTTLIETLTHNSVMHNCYVLSGNDVLYFKNPYISVSEDGIVGFNKENDYYGNIPSNDSFGKSPFFYPGTIFLLELINEVKI